MSDLEQRIYANIWTTVYLENVRDGEECAGRIATRWAEDALEVFRRHASTNIETSG